MKHIRWYDKNPDLKEVFEFIQGLDEEYQDKIAQDVLQILMQDFGLDLDAEINRISANYSYECKRWYDNNIDLFTSFEFIKNLNFENQQKIIKKIIETVLFMYLQEGK